LPGLFAGFGARLVRQEKLDVAFVSSAGLSADRLGYRDVELMSASQNPEASRAVAAYTDPALIATQTMVLPELLALEQRFLTSQTYTRNTERSMTNRSNLSRSLRDP